ncbi:MAG: proton-conducting transporter membrane subunit [Campylobacterota bacterium]|nr:proton-conducting transporter membrane subunit [Campylobacterota bacterium]
MSLVYFVALPILASFLTPLYKNYLKYVSVVLFAVLLGMVIQLGQSLPLVERVAFDSPLSITFVLDSASWFFTLLFIFVMLLFSVYNLKSENNRAVFILSNLLLSGVLGLVLSHDIFNIYIFFEIASISAYILTSLNRDKKAYGGVIRYMIIGTIASLFLLLAIMLIYLSIGSLNLTAIGENFNTIDVKIQFLIFLSLFIGFGIKVEVFPLNFWVADIYQASRSKVDALFSAILSKSYLFVFFHIAFILNVPSKYLGFLVVIGAVSFAVAEISALSSRDVKRIFAYSTLGQLGVLFLAFSYGSEVVITGAMFLIFMHSLTKLMLFLSLDILEQHFKSTKIDIFGVYRSLFLTFIFTIGFLSILGIPPFGGFIAKLTILKGLASLGEYVMIIVILAITLIEATYFFRLLGMTVGDGEKTPVAIPLLQKGVLALLALLLIYFGIFPETLLDLCSQAATAIMKGSIHV